MPDPGSWEKRKKSKRNYRLLFSLFSHFLSPLTFLFSWKSISEKQRHVSSVYAVVWNWITRKTGRRDRAQRVCEQESDCWGDSLPCLWERHWGNMPQMLGDILPCHCQSRGREPGRWGGMETGPCSVSQVRSLPALPPQVPLHNGFEALELKGQGGEVVGESHRRLSRARRSTPCLKTSSNKKARRVTAPHVGWTLPLKKSASYLGHGSGTLPGNFLALLNSPIITP